MNSAGVDGANLLATMLPSREGSSGVDQRPVGSTDVQLSLVGFGGAWLGHDVGDVSEVARATAVLRAVDATGVNWVDASETTSTPARNR
jgi:hypothetical protein